jgi:hypothetical protein
MPGLNNSHTPPQAIPPPTAAPVSVVVCLGSPLQCPPRPARSSPDRRRHQPHPGPELFRRQQPHRCLSSCHSALRCGFLSTRKPGLNNWLCRSRKLSYYNSWIQGNSQDSFLSLFVLCSRAFLWLQQVEVLSGVFLHAWGADQFGGGLLLAVLFLSLGSR